MIKAPYNFVPLASKVVFPEWGPQISIDRPFQDGISGTIEVTYTAQTPVFIGNGKDNNEKTRNYKAANGKYAIPGSTLRGMYRNVIEIISFGKFNRVSNAALSVRDLQNRDLYTSFFTKTEGGVFIALSKAGWLDRDEDDKWFLYPVEYHRVEDKKLEEYYKKNLKSRKSKERIKRISSKVKVYFSAGPVCSHQHHLIKKEKYLELKYSAVEKLSSTQFPKSTLGYTVLTGLCGRKHMDFIFEDIGSNSIPVSEEIIKTFDEVNIPNAANQSSGIALRKELREYKKYGYPGIPIFYLVDSENEPASMGLAQMYKLPYKWRLHDAIKLSSENSFSDEMDFAECIFGKTEDTNNKNNSTMNFSLRGRVQFEDATTENGILCSQVNTILGNPKPTYYPNYIEQNVKNTTYKTLMNNDVHLRGWKRYPVRNKPNPLTVGQDQQNVASHFQPLQEKTVFNGRIHFHNLKKEELGALIWAITWGNNKNLSHAVGMGKPYGYGQIKAEISSLSYLNNDADSNTYKNSSDIEQNDWIESFTNYMKEKVTDWSSCSQLKELTAMADPKNAERKGWDLSHMSLKNKFEKNEFVDTKKSHSFLAPYSHNTQELKLKKQTKS